MEEQKATPKQPIPLKTLKENVKLEFFDVFFDVFIGIILDIFFFWR
jgi:hypothetical protein